MLPDNDSLLRRLKVGDIFHASSPGGASLICLTTAVSKTHIFARTVTTQIEFEFEIQSGEAVWNEVKTVCTIDSVEPLPIDIHNIMLRFDRMFRLRHRSNPFKPNDAEERQALLFIGDFYRENPLS